MDMHHDGREKTFSITCNFLIKVNMWTTIHIKVVYNFPRTKIAINGGHSELVIAATLME